MKDFLYETRLEDVIRLATFASVLINMYFIKQALRILRQNRRSIAILDGTVNRGKAKKAFEQNDSSEMAEVMVPRNQNPWGEYDEDR